MHVNHLFLLVTQWQRTSAYTAPAVCTQYGTATAIQCTV